MPAGLLLAKLVATPLVIGLVTFVERRFGPAVAGLVFGMPLTSSLASAFLVVEQGAGFAQAATAGLLCGIGVFGLFLLAFAHAAARLGTWPKAIAVALALYLPLAAALAWLDLGWRSSVAVAIGALAASALAMPRGLDSVRARPHGRWELPLRMAIATALVVGLTAAARPLGPFLAGLLLLVPASTSTVGSFVLARAGPAPLVRMLRGLAWGAFSFVAFFIVLGVSLGTMPAPVAFLLASLAALGCSAATWRLAISRHRDAEVDDEP